MSKIYPLASRVLLTELHIIPQLGAQDDLHTFDYLYYRILQRAQEYRLTASLASRVQTFSRSPWPARVCSSRSTTW